MRQIRYCCIYVLWSLFLVLHKYRYDGKLKLEIWRNFKKPLVSNSQRTIQYECLILLPSSVTERSRGLKFKYDLWAGSSGTGIEHFQDYKHIFLINLYLIRAEYSAPRRDINRRAVGIKSGDGSKNMFSRLSTIIQWK